MSECGTYGGYQTHRKQSVPVTCEPCKQANNAYHRQYRTQKNPEGQRRNEAKQRARDRALRELARRHPDELAELYQAELQRGTR